ncbi:hypothetical protein LCGC14_1042810 [marine sediment metagenome]|uniref:Uncharacterized protein n=1 Tax=marine sediment metagenome TaxID=412755 RepID=A0A0F9QXH8_9ZZZZ
MSLPGQDTFEDAITRFRNRSIHAYVGHLLLFRGQILQDGEFGVQSGWDTATNQFIQEHLVYLDYWRRKITHNPQDVNIKTLEDRAKDLTISLPDEQNLKSPAGDEVPRPAGREFDLRHRLDGSDPNIPLLNGVDLRNVDARTFMVALDQHIVESTRLDSRYATYRITTRESLTLYSSLLEMFDLTVSFGGDENRVPVPHGVRPSEEPRGPSASPNREAPPTNT